MIDRRLASSAVEGLTIAEVLGDVERALIDSGAVVLSAPPGAGKTTAVPIHLAACSIGGAGAVVLAVPRRAAARAAARRIAFLLGEKVGESVALRTGDETIAASSPAIEVVTTGVVLRMLDSDPSLSGMSTLIFDEFHERSLDADAALAFALDARNVLRPDLNIVVMSATLDCAAVAGLIGKAAVVTAHGRSFPVDVVWLGAAGRDWAVSVARSVVRAHADSAASGGDLLVFCPGVPEIRRVRRALESGPTLEATDVLELHGSQSAAEQDKALDWHPESRRRVILATSIAETSLTLPGVTVVVDGGLARRNAFDARRGMGGLVTEPVAKATAEQRRGRAGRVRPGVCYRLWTEVDHRGRPDQPVPEIVDADLTGFALQLAAWGPSELRLLDHPSPGRLDAARSLLASLRLLDDHGAITSAGRRSLALGVHPRLGALIDAAVDRRVASLGVVLAALLSERDLLDGPPSQRPVDISERLSALVGNRQVETARRNRVLDSARRLAHRVGVSFTIADATAATEEIGGLVAAAFPDRVARARGNGNFLLTAGSGATVASHDPLARAPWLAIAELDLLERGGPNARVLLAAPLAAGDVGPGTVADEVLWRDGDVVARRVERLGSVVVRDEPLSSPDAALVTTALIEGLRAERLAPLPFTDTIRSWQDRVNCCHRHLCGDWPDLSDEALLSALDSWFVPFAAGIRRRRDLATFPLGDALGSLVPRGAARQLDRLVPTHVTVPSGSSIRLDYSVDPPVLAVKLQEMFGARETPLLGDGRIPLVVHLLSPAGHPLQVTADLASFWSNSYAAVRAEMRGRYPKHPWPEDPTTAAPTKRTNRALRAGN